MNKYLFYFALTLLCLGASHCAAQADPWEYCPPKRSLLVLKGGYGSMSIPYTNVTASGPGFGVEGYYLLDRHWMAGCGLSYFDNYVDGNDFVFTDFLVALRYRMNRSGSGPYLMAGTGLLSETYSFKDTDYLNMTFTNHMHLSYPYAMAGAGWELEVMKYTDLFLQVQARMIFEDSNSAYYLPIEAGINFGL